MFSILLHFREYHSHIRHVPHSSPSHSNPPLHLPLQPQISIKITPIFILSHLFSILHSTFAISTKNSYQTNPSFHFPQFQGFKCFGVFGFLLPSNQLWYVCSSFCKFISLISYSFTMFYIFKCELWYS